MPMDSDGWVKVDKPQKEVYSGGADERDPSVWVVFVKQLGDEKILVKMPEAPTYSYTEGGIEIVSHYGDGEHILQVVPHSSKSPSELMEWRKGQLVDVVIFSENSEKGEIVYWKEGEWYQEQYTSTEQNTCFFQTKSISLDAASHQYFVSSFGSESVKKN